MDQLLCNKIGLGPGNEGPGNEGLGSEGLGNEGLSNEGSSKGIVLIQSLIEW